MADLKQIKLPEQISNTLNSVNKTISENKDLKINVNSNIILEKDDTLNLPSISNIFNYEDMRSAADSFALKKKYHNEKQLNQITSQNVDIKEEIIFLERLRYETYGSRPFKGIVKNIENKWLKRLDILNLKKQKDSKDLFYFTLTLFFIDFANGKKWKLNNKHLKNITSKDNVSEFFNTLQKLSLIHI